MKTRYFYNNDKEHTIIVRSPGRSKRKVRKEKRIGFIVNKVNLNKSIIKGN